MTRNTERRVEIAYPVIDPTCRSMVMQYVNLQLADNVKARQLNAEGTWEKVECEEGAPRVDAQQSLIVLSYDRARKARDNEDVPLVPEASVVPPIPEVLHGLPLDEIVVSEASEELEATAEETVEDVDASEVFSHTAQVASEPVPPLIVRAQERASEHHAEVVEVAEAAQTVVADESVAPKAGRVSRALGLFGAGFRTLFRGE